MAAATLSVKNVTHAMRVAGGIVSEAARALGVTRSGLQKWLAKHPDVRAISAEYREAMVDEAEAQIRVKIEDGDLDAIKFALSTAGRGRGFIAKIPDVVASSNLEALRRIVQRLGLDDIPDERLMIVSLEVKAEMEAEKA